MIKLQVPNDPRLLALAGQFLLACSGNAVASAVGTTAQTTDQTSGPLTSALTNTDAAVSGQDLGDDNAAPIVTAAGELDRDKFPWDKRIHSSGKAKLQDGTWKLARNVDPALVAQVRAEYLANSTGTAVADDTPPPPGFGQTAGNLPPPPPGTTAGSSLPPPPPPGAGAGPAIDNPVALFQDTMKLYASATTSKLITAEWAADWCKQNGLTGLPGLMANPAACASFAELLRTMGAA